MNNQEKDVTTHLSIIIPAYNEGQNLIAVHEEITQTMGANGWANPYELIIVDDGSWDDTGRIADDLADKNSTTQVIHHHVNQGLGSALRTGFSASQGQFVSWISADGEIDVEHILDLLRVSNDADLVVSGARLRVGIVAWYREIITSIFILMNRMILGFDPHQNSGVYVIRGCILRQLKFHTSTGMVNAEVFLQCIKRQLRIKTGPPLQARQRLGGKSKVANLPTILKICGELIKLRLILFTD